MKNSYKDSFEQIKIAGGLAAEALDEVTAFVKPGVTTDKLDKISSKHSDRPSKQLDPIERAIIWIGLMELLSDLNTPVNVVINEAIELAKIYGAQDSYQFINAVLDSFLNKHSPR